MKYVNKTFRFSRDCPYNLDGTCTNPETGCDNLNCGIGKKEPPEWCTLKDVQKTTSDNSDYTSAVKKLIYENAECTSTPNGDYLKKSDVIDCLNFASQNFV